VSNDFQYDRQSIRLLGFDYSQNGSYFVTICVQDRQRIFGEIVPVEMRLNDVGKMIDKWWNKLVDKFDIALDSYVIMPDHLHGIIVIGQGEHPGSPLPKMIQWFKTMTTNEYIQHVKQNNWTPFRKRVWQRNYYEHIIRNESEYFKIVNYIRSNPENWEKDKLFMKLIN